MSKNTTNNSNYLHNEQKVAVLETEKDTAENKRGFRYKSLVYLFLLENFKQKCIFSTAVQALYSFHTEHSQICPAATSYADFRRKVSSSIYERVK